MSQFHLSFQSMNCEQIAKWKRKAVETKGKDFSHSLLNAMDEFDKDVYSSGEANEFFMGRLRKQFANYKNV